MSDTFDWIDTMELDHEIQRHEMRYLDSLESHHVYSFRCKKPNIGGFVKVECCACGKPVRLKRVSYSKWRVCELSSGKGSKEQIHACPQWEKQRRQEAIDALPDLSE